MAGTSCWGGGGVTLLQLREQTSCCDEGVKRETGSKNCASPEVCGELEISEMPGMVDSFAKRRDPEPKKSNKFDKSKQEAKALERL